MVTSIPDLLKGVLDGVVIEELLEVVLRSGGAVWVHTEVELEALEMSTVFEALEEVSDAVVRDPLTVPEPEFEVGEDPWETD